ncbi:actin-like protein 9 [Erinaceus europaeus]|uniref:Actin-like protein 9 n=1 Tax=Erinaceus europaeus TaxID=9365 RepID=A0A1S3AM01_ERIEU|nr:actin-like protein 9 [Erinaceus europaeus]
MASSQPIPSAPGHPQPPPVNPMCVLSRSSPSSGAESLLSPMGAAVVVDMGSGTCKVGFSGQARPLYTVDTLVGWQPGRPAVDTLVGEAARAQPDVTLVQPVRHGIVVEWEAAELLWRHLLEHDLRVGSGAHPLLFSDPPFSPATNREQLVEVVFEGLGAPAMFVASQAVLSVYAHGRVSGLVVDVGHGVTSTCPVVQGTGLPRCTERLDLAGAHLTAYLAEVLQGAGLSLGHHDLTTVEALKHSFCYVAPQAPRVRAPPEEAQPRTLRLPDGRKVTLQARGLFQCPELLFEPPEVPGLKPVGVPAMAQRSLQGVPPNARPEVARHILLCGGSSLFPGFEGRFRTELLRRLPPGTPPVEVVAQPARHLSVWLGGSILASLRAFQTCWVLRAQYEEQGPHIVYSKCY